jgi:hypothetical protein
MLLAVNTLQAQALPFWNWRNHQTLTPHHHQPALPAAAINDLVISTVDEKSGIAMLTVNRPPANTLSLEM